MQSVDTTFKVCSKCKLPKHLASFTLEKRRTGQYKPRATCKACVNVYTSRRYQENKPRLTVARNAWNERNPDAKFRFYLRQCGLTASTYDAMLLEQGGVCGLCGAPFGEGQIWGPQVDHDHGNGLIRGIIHGSCNKALGLLRDSSKVAFRAVEYLRKHGK